MAQVFLSYAHRNHDAAHQIASGLTAAGYTLWWDRRLHAGDDFSRDIETELQNANCVVVVWSAAARNSLWVRAEANAALEQDKLVQVAAENTRPPLPFTMLHLLDLSNWNGAPDDPAFRNLCVSVGDLIAGGGVREHMTEAKRAGPSLFAPMVAVGAGSIGLIAVAGAVAAMMATQSADSDLFGALTVGTFAAACLGLGYMLMRTIEIGLASRRPA